MGHGVGGFGGGGGIGDRKAEGFLVIRGVVVVGSLGGVGGEFKGGSAKGAGLELGFGRIEVVVGGGVGKGLFSGLGGSA